MIRCCDYIQAHCSSGKHSFQGLPRSPAQHDDHRCAACRRARRDPASERLKFRRNERAGVPAAKPACRAPVLDVAAVNAITRSNRVQKAKHCDGVSDKHGARDVAARRQTRMRLSPAALIRYDPHRHRAGRKDRRRRASAEAACNVPCNLMEKNLMSNILKVGVAAAVIALGAGCTDLKPLQAEVDSLKSQVAKLSGDLDGVKTSADGASRAAAAAQQAATSAQNTANQAASAAQAAQQCCDANSEKLNRMFEKSMSK